MAFDSKQLLSELTLLQSQREAFFQFLRQYLRPEVLVDGDTLGTSSAELTARIIRPAEWIQNGQRGYVTILPNVSAGRTFRLTVLQQGSLLRLGVRLPPDTDVEVVTALLGIFPGMRPVQTRLASGELKLDWEFSVPDLYSSIIAFETALFRVHTLFSNTFHRLTEQQKEIF